MDNVFNVEIAIKYGINCSIILKNLYYWTEKNKANNINYHDGYYWTYNTNKAFAKLFPFLTDRQIRYALATLKKEGLIITANYSQGCDRTLWYAVTEKAIKIMQGCVKETINDNSENLSESILEGNNIEEKSSKLVQNCQNELTSLSNGNMHFCQMELTMVSNGTNNKQQIINNKEKETYNKEKEDPVRCVFNFWNSKNLIKSPELTPKLNGLINKVLKSFTLNEVITCITRYDKALNNSEYWLTHKWSLKSFLSQPNALPEFRDDGEKWLNLSDWLDKNKSNNFIRNNYTENEINEFISDLDNIEIWFNLIHINIV